MNGSTPNRRPLKSRSTRWAQALAGFLVRRRVAPDHISIASIAFAVAGAAALLQGAQPVWLMIAAVCVQLRLLCNLLDGMVAVEGGLKSPVGVLYNEIPDRIADSLFLVALGYAAQAPAAGWLAALAAAITAYIRLLGGTLGFTQDFRGPMAKPHRMAVLTGACVVAAIEAATMGSHHTLPIAAWLIAAGALLTCVTRTRALAQRLRAA